MITTQKEKPRTLKFQDDNYSIVYSRSQNITEHWSNAFYVAVGDVVSMALVGNCNRHRC